MTSRGVRASIGPRAARVHVGGGYRPGISTGAGPFTYYHSLGGSPSPRRSSSHPSPPRRVGARAAAQAARARDARHAAAALEELSTVHRQRVEAVEGPAVAEAPAVDERSIRNACLSSARAGLGWWRLGERRRAKASGLAAAAARITEARAAAASEQAACQERLDRAWRALQANDHDTVLAALAAAFEDNGTHAAAVSARGAEAGIVAIIGGPQIVPERMAATTAAGNATTKTTTKTAAASIYATAACSHLLHAVRVAFAAAPGLHGIRAAAVRASEPDGNGHRRPECVLAAHFSRTAIDGVDWRSDPVRIVETAATELASHVVGRAKEWTPLDLAAEPDLAAMLGTIDLDGEPDGEGSQPSCSRESRVQDPSPATD